MIMENPKETIKRQRMTIALLAAALLLMAAIYTAQVVETVRGDRKIETLEREMDSIRQRNDLVENALGNANYELGLEAESRWNR